MNSVVLTISDLGEPRSENIQSSQQRDDTCECKCGLVGFVQRQIQTNNGRKLVSVYSSRTSELLPGAAQKNNRAEAPARVEALQVAPGHRDPHLHVYSKWSHGIATQMECYYFK